MLERDGHQCVFCGIGVLLEAQHRRAVGMGGSKTSPALDDLIVLCATHNNAAEGALQMLALARGWKVRRFVKEPGLVPVFYAVERVWFVLTKTGERVPISPAVAVEAMRGVYGDEWDRWEQELAA